MYLSRMYIAINMFGALCGMDCCLSGSVKLLFSEGILVQSISHFKLCMPLC
jgi:hypothetical protein